MFEPLVEVGKWLYSLVPKRFRFWKVKLNFIVVHYIYMIIMSLAGSVILYGSGLIPYIDAIFFGTGSSTQSGLNTINLNEMKLYQQIVMFFIANITNPIFINTVVVFVRLYWFEKRFERIVKDVREQRRSRAKTITRTKSEMRADTEDLHRMELGVNGRQIKVLHETTKPNGMTGTSAPTNDEAEKFKDELGLREKAESVEPTPEGSNKSSADGREENATQENVESNGAELDTPTSATSEHHLGLNPRLHREIAFADEVDDPDSPNELGKLASVPDHQDMSKHIEFLERQQRNAKAGTALRIPGPRAFDRGEVPQQTEDMNDNELHRPQTRNTLQPIKSESDYDDTNTAVEAELNGDDHPERGGGIRWNEQEHPGHRQQDDSAFEQSATQNSRFNINRIRSGVGSVINRRRTNTNNLLHLSNARGSLGRTFSTLTTVRTRERNQDPMPYLSWQATTGRNSAFLGLTEEQREELGGIEYRTLKTLAKVLICYFVGWHVFGMVILVPWIMHKQKFTQVVVDDGIDPGWWGVFSAASLFNDLGLTLTPDSMVSFKTSSVVMVLGTFLIIIGNTGFPVMLRFVIWIASKCAPYGSGTWEELRFLLDHPRRCFTLLFPAKATWWLFWILVALNGVDLIFFIILDLNDATVTSIPPWYRFLAGLFQAASTRTAGFSSVNLSDLHPAIQVSYMVMMYISVFPIAISIRRTNVYEEKSLGVWAGDEVSVDPDTDPSYVGQHLRRQLSFDLWYIFLGLFIISIVEGGRIANNKDTAFTMYSVLFEIVSAYGTVGLSLGYPGTNTSFSAEFQPLSKLIICAMMLRGRHRGLPYALDRAILLPSEQMQKKETEDANRRARRGSFFADGPEADRLHAGATWAQGDVDENGKGIEPVASATGRAATMPPGEEHSPERSRHVRRVASGISNTSARDGTRPGPWKHDRRRSLSRVIAGGLSAGPSISKHD